MSVEHKFHPSDGTYIIRGTNSDLDDLEVICGPAYVFHYIDFSPGEFRKKIVCRPVLSFVEDVFTEEDDHLELEGIWIEDKSLKLNNEDITETTVPGEHYRTFILHVDDFEITLVEYADRLQIGVVRVIESVCFASKVLLSEYKERKHFGSIKLLMDECQTPEDVTEFIEEVKQL